MNDRFRKVGPIGIQLRAGLRDLRLGTPLLRPGAFIGGLAAVDVFLRAHLFGCQLFTALRFKLGLKHRRLRLQYLRLCRLQGRLGLQYLGLQLVGIQPCKHLPDFHPIIVVNPDGIDNAGQFAAHIDLVYRFQGSGSRYRER